MSFTIEVGGMTASYAGAASLSPQRLEILLALAGGLSVIDRVQTGPPRRPGVGHRYIVASPAEDEWAGQEGRVAVWVGDAWAFLNPVDGLTAWDEDAAESVQYSASAWAPVTGGSTTIYDAKSVTILSPSASEKVLMFVARANWTVTRIDCAIGSATSVTFAVRKGTDPSGSGTAVVTAGTTANTTATVQTVTSFDSATIASGDAVWLTTSAISGTPSWLHVTVHMERPS